MPVSATYKQAAYAAETGEAPIVLLTIDHADLAAPIRVTSDAVDTASRGDTYVAFPFRVSLPDDTEEAARARLEIDNVDRRIVEAVRSISSPPSVRLEVVLAGTPDLVEAGPFDFELEETRYDLLVVSGELAFEPVLDLAMPADSLSPGLFPGLFS
ncbi:MAG: DUF1833 family protein [Inquilinus sp.]|nr:DUF1833 family protein [Inquilinus sp.]